MGISKTGDPISINVSKGALSRIGDPEEELRQLEQQELETNTLESADKTPKPVEPHAQAAARIKEDKEKAKLAKQQVGATNNTETEKNLFPGTPANTHKGIPLEHLMSNKSRDNSAPPSTPQQQPTPSIMELTIDDFSVPDDGKDTKTRNNVEPTTQHPTSNIEKLSLDDFMDMLGFGEKKDKEGANTPPVEPPDDIFDFDKQTAEFKKSQEEVARNFWREQTDFYTPEMESWSIQDIEKKYRDMNQEKEAKEEAERKKIKDETEAREREQYERTRQEEQERLFAYNARRLEEKNKKPREALTNLPVPITDKGMSEAIEAQLGQGKYTLTELTEEELAKEGIQGVAKGLQSYIHNVFSIGTALDIELEDIQEAFKRLRIRIDSGNETGPAAAHFAVGRYPQIVFKLETLQGNNAQNPTQVLFHETFHFLQYVIGQGTFRDRKNVPSLFSESVGNIALHEFAAETGSHAMLDDYQGFISYQPILFGLTEQVANAEGYEKLSYRDAAKEIFKAAMGMSQSKRVYDIIKKYQGESLEVNDQFKEEGYTYLAHFELPTPLTQNINRLHNPQNLNDAVAALSAIMGQQAQDDKAEKLVNIMAGVADVLKEKEIKANDTYIKAIDTIAENKKLSQTPEVRELLLTASLRHDILQNNFSQNEHIDLSNAPNFAMRLSDIGVQVAKSLAPIFTNSPQSSEYKETMTNINNMVIQKIAALKAELKKQCSEEDYMTIATILDNHQEELSDLKRWIKRNFYSADQDLIKHYAPETDFTKAKPGSFAKALNWNEHYVPGTDFKPVSFAEALRRDDE